MRFNLKIEVLLSLFFFGIAALAIYGNHKLDRGAVQTGLTSPVETAAIQRMFYYSFEWMFFYE